MKEGPSAVGIVLLRLDRQPSHVTFRVRDFHPQTFLLLRVEHTGVSYRNAYFSTRYWNAAYVIPVHGHNVSRMRGGCDTRCGRSYTPLVKWLASSSWAWHWMRVIPMPSGAPLIPCVSPFCFCSGFLSPECPGHPSAIRLNSNDVTSSMSQNRSVQQ